MGYLMSETLGQYIAERRSALGLTQEQLAERVGEGVRQSEISRLEHDRVLLPRRLRMEQIAQALDVPVGVLLLKSGWTGAEGISDGPGSGAAGEGQAGAGIQEVPVGRVDRLQTENEALRAAIDRLHAQADVRDSALAVVEALVGQLRAVLNGVYDAVVVVNRRGLIVLENTAYAVFSATHTDTPVMLDVQGVRIPDTDLPLDRAANGERFSMIFGVEHDGARQTYQAHGQPVSTVGGGLLGVLTIQAANDHDAPPAR